MSNTPPPCTPPAPPPSQPIVDTILADVNAIIPNFSSLVSSYRLLVGAAEEIHRIPNICPDVFERAVRRFDNAGTLIDILLDLLCCKIDFSSDFLHVSCAPVDLFRLFANRSIPCDQSHLTADQIITLEAVRKALADCLDHPCLPDQPVVCPEVPNRLPPTSPIQSTTSFDTHAETDKELVSKANVHKPLGTSANSCPHREPSNSEPLTDLPLNSSSISKHRLVHHYTKESKTDPKIKSPVRRLHI